ncbi:MAG: MTH1187 family thiamine-binding protein [Thermoguttaceae bacterium]|nr:MTH1187 family thiamine-binding protein [Thermoguttaceae bacterium]MDW8078053.1 MTH1187 family thiamine-binding protein [Thermoguttaceae bacterium]
MVVAEISIYPLDKGVSLSPYVARCVQIIDESGLDYRCHAMGTVIEGSLEQILDVVKKCFHALQTDCDRIECYLRLDYRKGYTGRIEAKVTSVEARLGRPVKK